MTTNKLWSWVRSHLLFVVIVLIPTSVSIIYFGLIASDVYISESEFVISSQDSGLSSASDGISSLLMGASLGHSHGDAYEVRDYILSRDALKELQSRLQLNEIFGRPGVSFADRYPNLVYDKSFEELFRYYTKHVTCEPDAISSISTLSVRAFTAADARRINEELLNMAEQLVNKLNDRSRRDMIQFAQKEVDIASEKAKNAAVALLEARSRQSVFEPTRQAAMQLEGVAKLHQELITTEAEVAEIRKLSPDNPQISALESNAALLRKTIAEETGKVTSPNGSFSAHAPEFERLELDQDFADKQLGYAMAALESARADAQKKQIYLERLTQPSLQDKSLEPHRFRSILATFIISLIAFGVASILVATVREHAD